MAGEIVCDVFIAGGGLGGCAAALAAARCGLRVVMSEETEWIGGQLTSQATPPDEHPWIEQFGCTRSYRQLRCHIRDYYRERCPITEEAGARLHLNPGNGLVSRLCCEPRAALFALQSMLAPFVDTKMLTILTRHRLEAGMADQDRVQAARLQNQENGADLIVSARYFLDATETGDLLSLTGTEYVVGSEGGTGEPHGSPVSLPENQQAFTFCFAMEHLPGENHIIDKPAGYSWWRDYVPNVTPPWPGTLLSLTGTNPITLQARRYLFDPEGEPTGGQFGLWRYRRILDRSNFRDGAYPGDISLVNWPMNDYMIGPIIDVSAEQATARLSHARDLSLSLLYWLQTEAPRPDGGVGWPGLRLRADVMGSEDGLALAPYIRESRRIRAEFTVLEQHVAASGKTDSPIEPARFPDSVGIGSYRIDLHPSAGGDNYIDVASRPFEIPLGALIPIRTENLMPAAKNLGVTHITNGCFRLHPVEWNVGEAAGLLAAYCLSREAVPRMVRRNASHLEAYRNLLVEHGVELSWPSPLTP
ncbi:MAG TPA: FAD-dependent oxidoreductase [Chthonomonadales bacterium]|nr:FAD-dependent oxidoreductase [Chthonomonadales bacterium]